jgi:hypothetical protein
MRLSETRWTQSLADDCALTRAKEITAIEGLGSRSSVAVVGTAVNALRPSASPFHPR